jgi:predicted esterase
MPELLELRHRDTSGTGSRWVWRSNRGAPDADALAACGFPGSIFLPSPGARNLLLLLHGLGDQPEPFAQLARKMALPQTASLALRAPIALPFGLAGSQWHASFDEASGEPITPSTGEMRRLRSLERETRPRLLRLLDLLDTCGWPAQRIFLLGYAQGGTAAIDLALHATSRLGGVVSVCGHCLPEAAAADLQPVRGGARATPLLIISALQDADMAIAEARRLFEAIRSAFGGGVQACSERTTHTADKPDAHTAERESGAKGRPRGGGEGAQEGGVNSSSVTMTELPGRASMGGSEAQVRCMMTFFAEHLELSSKALEEDPTLIRVV